MTPLKPCPVPWCGHDDQFLAEGGGWWVQCPCGANGLTRATPEEAAEAWNARDNEHPSAPAPDLVSALENHVNHPNWHPVTTGAVAALERHRAQASAQQDGLSFSGRWIPVSERLPETRSGKVQPEYPVCGGTAIPYVTSAYFENGWWVSPEDTETRFYNVTHWAEPIKHPTEARA